NGTVKFILGIPYYVGFTLNGFPVGVSLSQGRRNSPARTSLVAEAPAIVPFSLWICPEGRDTALGQVAKMPEFKGMSAEFDSLFRVRGDDEHGARQFLTAEIQALLLKWHSRNVDVGFANNKFCFSVRELLNEENTLDDFIDDAGLLLARIGRRG
ncbi:MAG: hypothetical protein K8I00_01170, partial [Candidatus Omnitrophica bacterium]|nr:hypothetical protein [Candidatus Omnitrophota bacterium]